MRALSPPIIALVTDRQRLGGSEDELVRLVHAAVEAGVTLVQVRERDLDDRSLFDLTGRILRAVRRAAARVVVNDRADVALAAGAHGVHLRADSFSASHVRRIAPPDFIVGRSVHSAREAAAAVHLDYVLMGTVFPTRSKEDGAVLAGLAGLEEACRVCPVPVLAIGGVAADNLASIAAAGAAGIAAIGLFADAHTAAGGRRIETTLAELVARVRLAFAVPSRG